MGRIFVGLCQVGAWGCFDEFNRLEERMLSAVSQQVQYIQVALREHSNLNRDRSKYNMCGNWGSVISQEFVLELVCPGSSTRDSKAFTHKICCGNKLPTIFCSSRCAHHYRAAEQAGEGEPRHGHLHHNEPWLCWPLQPA